MGLLLKTNWENSGGAKRREEMPAHNMSCQPPRNPHARIHLGWQMRASPGSTESDQIRHKQDNWPETTQKANPITTKPETVSQVAEQFSWVPLPCCSLSGCPFQIKSFVLSVKKKKSVICDSLYSLGYYTSSQKTKRQTSNIVIQRISWKEESIPIC